MFFQGMNKSSTGLLVIDLVNSCAHENCEIKELRISFSKIREMAPRLVTFIDWYRKNINNNVVFTKTVPWKKGFVAENINELYEDPNVTYYSKDEPGFPEQFYLVKPEEGDLIVAKDTNDAFAMKELLDWAKLKGVKYFIMTGIFTDGCVLASLYGGFSRGYNFVLVKDLVETTDSKTRQELQKLLIESNFPFLVSRVVESKELPEIFNKTRFH